MEENKNIHQESFKPDQARKDIEDANALKAENKLILDNMKLDYGCEHMDRIVEDLILPEYVDLVYLLNDNDVIAEIVTLDTEHPHQEDVLCNIGIKFRCGDNISPCKIEFMADPNEYVFNLVIRNPAGEVSYETWPFFATIPLKIRKHLQDFITNFFPEIPYEPEINDFNQYDQNLEGPFKIEMEEDGKKSALATVDTLEEAIKMGGSFSKMFKNQILHILDNEDNIIC